MSDAVKRMPLAQAEKLAQQIVAELAPACERIEIAGSIRRRKPEIGDVELVAIPKMEIGGVDLLGEGIAYRPLNDVLTTICLARRLEVAKGFKRDLDWKAAQFEVLSGGAGAPPTCKLDIFLASVEAWGCIFTIRTGPAEFSHRLVTDRQHNGLCPSHLRFRNGRIQSGLRLLPTPEESDVFKALGLAFIPPEKRA